MLKRLSAVTITTVCTLGLASGPALAAPGASSSGTAAPASARGHAAAPSRHVLVLSIDGMHEQDLQWYVRQHPRSALARLAMSGTSYTHARTTFPSDSFPGMVAQFTGANPGTSGVFYDDTYSHALMAPGTTRCATAPRGTEVSWTEAMDRSQAPITLDAGQGLSSPSLRSLPTNTRAQTLAAAKQLTPAILKLTPTARQLLDPKNLPVNPVTCAPLYPHQYLRTNTVFNVARAAGMRTAWSDKHPAYEILNGPGGDGVQDLFTPEINGVADAAGDDWSSDNLLTREYDSFKVAAVTNEIRGRDHSGTHRVGMPAIFGMNFQSVSTAQKLAASDGLAGGYTAKGTPGPLLSQALDYVDGQVSALEHELRVTGHARDTTVILSAKHGQSPVDPQLLRRVDDGPIIDGLNAAWAAKHPGAKQLVSFSVNDDLMLIWLSDRSPAAGGFVRTYLMTHAAPANRVGDAKGVHSATVTSSGLSQVLTGAAAKSLVGARSNDPSAPDVIGIAQHGVVYTGGVKKVAEHGGASGDDRDVPLVVSGAGAWRAVTVGTRVSTTQVAPTILHLLGLDPRALDGVRADHTRVLPALQR